MTEVADKALLQMLEVMRPALTRTYQDAVACGTGWIEFTVEDGIVAARSVHPSKVMCWKPKETENAQPEWESIMADFQPTEGITDVNRHLGIAMLRHETPLPIINWSDADGAECLPDNAVTCVAGDDAHGWWAIDLTAYSRNNFN